MASPLGLWLLRVVYIEDRRGPQPAQGEADQQSDQRTHAPMLGGSRSAAEGPAAAPRSKGSVFIWPWTGVHLFGPSAYRYRSIPRSTA